MPKYQDFTDQTQNDPTFLQKHPHLTGRRAVHAENPYLSFPFVGGLQIMDIEGKRVVRNRLLKRGSRRTLTLDTEPEPTILTATKNDAVVKIGERVLAKAVIVKRNFLAGKDIRVECLVTAEVFDLVDNAFAPWRTSARKIVFYPRRKTLWAPFSTRFLTVQQQPISYIEFAYEPESSIPREALDAWTLICAYYSDVAKYSQPAGNWQKMVEGRE